MAGKVFPFLSGHWPWSASAHLASSSSQQCSVFQSTVSSPPLIPSDTDRDSGGYYFLIMDSQEFKVRGRQMVDYIIQYLEEIETRRVTPAIEPGYLSDLIPASPPHDPEPWEDVMKDVEEKIMVGMTHWQHPRFHAYFPAGNSFPSILADMLAGAIGCVGFSWVN